MSYQSVYVYLGGSADATSRIELAVQVAQLNNAKLVGISLRELAQPAIRPAASQGHDNIAVVESPPAKEFGATQAALEQFEAIALKSGLKRYEIYYCEPDKMTDTFGSCATPGNLLVLGPDMNVAASQSDNLDLLEYLILNSNSSVLVVPEIWSASLGVENVLIAWDGSAAAYRSLQDALPFLSQAKRVVLATVDTKAARRISPLHSEVTAIAFLSQHYITPKIELLHSDLEPGRALLELATATPSCLVVMGCVAHPHWKAVLLGGTTRVMLASCTVPICMHR